MNQSKFSLADVLTILTALGFGFICFLGTNFYTLGNVPKSITVALIIMILLFSTAFVAKLLKRTSVNFRTCFIWEMLLLVLFTLLFVFFTYMPFSHYFTVSAKQTEIVSKIQTSITQAENMFPAYESYAANRISLYKSKLISVVANKGGKHSEYQDYGFRNNMVDNTQIKHKMGNINADLFPTNYSDTTTQKGIKEVAKKWLLKAKEATESWKPIGITNVVLAIEVNSNEWKSILVNLSQIREKGQTDKETEEFEYPLKFEDVKQFFTKVEKPTLTSLLIALLIWVLMMLSWFVTKRHTKFPGFKLLFGTSQASNNEL